MGIHGGDAFVQQLRREGIMAAVIGQTDSGNNRLLYSGGNARYLERPAEDETKKLGFFDLMSKQRSGLRMHILYI